jgi:hypothetical protein
MHYHQTISPKSSGTGDYVFIVSPGAVPASGQLQYPFLGDNTAFALANFTVGETITSGGFPDFLVTPIAAVNFIEQIRLVSFCVVYTCTLPAITVSGSSTIAWFQEPLTTGTLLKKSGVDLSPFIHV